MFQLMQKLQSSRMKTLPHGKVASMDLKRAGKTRVEFSKDQRKEMVVTR